MLKVKIFRGVAESFDVEEGFNAWSTENEDIQIATAQFVVGEAGMEKLIVFYTERQPALKASARPASQIVLPFPQGTEVEN
jgi:hypothetical protein